MSEDRATGHPVAPLRDALAPANVLLVGGPAHLQMLETLLDGLGLNLVRAGSGEEAQVRLSREDFAVVLLDVQTPGRTGLETARLIRGRPETRHLPIIFIRPLHDAEFPADLAYTLGAVDYLEEPLVPVILRAKVSGFVELYHHMKHARQLEKEAVERRLAEERLRAVAEQERRHAEELARLNRELEREITERRRAEETLRRSEQLYRAVGESIDYGVWVCDPAGRNLYASPSFLKLVGLTQEEWAAFGWGQALHPDEAEPTLAAWRECVRSGANWDREHRFRGVDGEWHPVLSRGVPVRDDRGQVVYWAGINLDIRSIKEAEEALRQADRHKDAFLAMLAHELRNPLAPLRNSLTALRLRGDDPAVREQGLAMAERQVEQLTRLLDDLLDMARIRQGKLVLKAAPVDLNEIVAHAVETVRPAVEAQQHSLEVVVPPCRVPLNGNPVRLQQVFVNLLTNACRYTPPGGRIRLTLDVKEGQAVVSVRDTGIGLAADMRTRIFNLYAQADSAREQDQSGLGIGLALVRGLVTSHGGSVQAHSDGPGRGSEFVVRLPLQAQEPQEQEPSPRPEESADSELAQFSW